MRRLLITFSIFIAITSCATRSKLQPFKIADEQNDGHICQIEIDNFITGLFSEFDKDNSKFLEVNELRKMGLNINDHNNDERISIFEMYRNKENIMKQLDANGDNCLNAQELTNKI